MSVTFFFFFKQKTAYEMRISDWSSDVCSSDLHKTTNLRVGRSNRSGCTITSLRCRWTSGRDLFPIVGVGLRQDRGRDRLSRTCLSYEPDFIRQPRCVACNMDCKLA